MAKRNAPQSLQELVEQVTGQLTALIAAEIERRVKESLGNLKSQPKLLTSKHARLCPVPGCGQPGKGPRNRYFCSDHSKSLSVEEQKSILARNKRLEAEGKVAERPSGPQIVRLPPRVARTPRTLDMSCRVEGCGNRSRGPRAGFICDTHRAQLTPEEQGQARERWNARKKAGEQQVPALPPVAVAPVPPILRKAEPVAVRPDAVSAQAQGE